MCEHGPMIFSVHVDVQLRPGIADPQGSTIERSLHLLDVAGNLERVADLSTNIGEDVIFMVEGRVIKHHHEDEEQIGRT